MTTRERTTARRSSLLIVAALAGACSNPGRTCPEAGACPPAPVCPDCAARSESGPQYEAMFTSVVVTVSAGDVQTFLVKLMVRQHGKWYELAVADQSDLVSAEPTENTVWKTGEKLLGIIKANPNNVGEVAADNLTWRQRGRAAYAWDYGPYENTQDKVLIVSTFRWLEGETSP